MNLELQVNGSCVDKTVRFSSLGGAAAMMTPLITESYWLFRVPVSDKQAIVGFPKFSTIGIGFQHEEDWNTNLPYSSPADEIFDHISHNKGDDTIPDERCIEAIKLVQDAAAILKGAK
jgi:hypothetical protein